MARLSGLACQEPMALETRPPGTKSKQLNISSEALGALIGLSALKEFPLHGCQHCPHRPGCAGPRCHLRGEYYAPSPLAHGPGAKSSGALSLGECKRVVRWIGRPCACARLGSRASQGLAFSLMISLGFWMYNYEVGASKASKASKASRVPINPARTCQGSGSTPARAGGRSTPSVKPAGPRWPPDGTGKGSRNASL